MRHFIIPDTQCKPLTPTSHLTAAGNYIVDKQPDVIIHLGDHWDMHSLSSYDRGTAKAEGARYEKDIEAGIRGMEALLKPIQDYNKKHRKKYKPRKVFIPGNHEDRVPRHVNANPALIGKLSFKDFCLTGFDEEKQKFPFDWEVQPYLRAVKIDGIYYAHYFYNRANGKPYTGNARNMLNTLGFSFTQGHRQGKDPAEKFLNNGQVLRALIAGSFYQHDEDYLGPQGENYWRGCIMKHEVKDGNYDIMELSLNYLMRSWL